MMELYQLMLVVNEKLDRVLAQMEKQATKEWYTTKEAAKVLGKTEWTLRNDWIKNKKIKADKINHRNEWRIPHSEILRIQEHGPNRPQGGV